MVEKQRSARRAKGVFAALRRRPLVPVLYLRGVIGLAGRSRLSFATLESVIERAFSYKSACAVAIVVNSPGGSPVQTSLIYQTIRRHAQQTDTQVLIFCEDVAASGGYWLACAGEAIYADASSIIGSIGVISSGFGFDRVAKRWDIDRRVYTAGLSKGMLDPFLPERPDDVAKLSVVLQSMHEAFQDVVRARRGDKLQGGDVDLFDGGFWTGRRALELGLIDGVGDLHSVLRERFGENVRLRPIKVKRPRRWAALPGMRADAGLPWAAENVVECVRMIGQEWSDQALWARYGL